MGGSSSSHRRRQSGQQQHHQAGARSHPTQQPVRMPTNQYPSQYPGQQPVVFRGPPPQQQQQQPAYQPVMADAETIKNSCAYIPNTAKLSDDCTKFTCSINALVDCRVELLLGVVESIHGGVVLEPLNSSASRREWAVQVGDVAAGEDKVIEVHLPPLSDMQEYKRDKPKHLPMVLTIHYSGKNEKTGAKTNQAEFSYFTVKPKVHLIRQLVQVDQSVYVVETLYGADHEEGTQDDEDPVVGALMDAGDEDEACVICLTNDKTTTVLPCRHMCMCKECAEQLRTQTMKCPVCRGPITQLMSRNASTPPPS